MFLLYFAFYRRVAILWGVVFPKHASGLIIKSLS